MTDTSVEQTKGAEESNPAAAANETDELDALLAEFDQEADGTEQTTQTQTTTQSGSENELADQVRQLVDAEKARTQEKIETDARQGVDEAVGWVKDVLVEKELEVPEGAEDLIEGSLQTAARKDPRIAKAFMERHKRPSAWKKIVVAHAQGLTRYFPQANQDSQREKAAAAVAQSRSGKSSDQDFPSAEELGKMSDREFFKLAKGMTGNM